MTSIQNLDALIDEAIKKAVAQAIAEHEREGRGDMVRAAQANPDGTLPSWAEYSNGHNANA